MLKARLGLPLAILFAANAELAFAQVQPDVLPAQTVAPPLQSTWAIPGVTLQFAPRFWYLFATAGEPKQNNFVVSHNSDSEYPMAGFAASANFAGLPETTFVLTALYGEAT